MHEEDISLTKEAFTTMLKQCAKTGQVERAFFYMDEMRAYDAEPDIRTYVLLFRACAEAPHWVDGYHDIIFDAMAKMEGAELMPTAEVQGISIAITVLLCYLLHAFLTHIFFCLSLCSRCTMLSSMLSVGRVIQSPSPSPNNTLT